MTPEEVFADALKLAPDERARFLEKECRDNTALLEELLSLLDAHERHPNLLLATSKDRSYEVSPGGVPAEVGPYRIRGELGRGGAGVVYRAEDTRGGREVALKVLHLPSGVGSIPRALAREAQALASLHHPCVSRVYTMETIDGVDLVSMELVRGQSLANTLAGGRLPTRRALRIARQIAMALEMAHTRGVLHLDLKPANILVSVGETRDGLRVKVLDFGISRWIGLDGPRSIPVGTPGYASPAILDGCEASPADDLWAFGCVLYELLTGTPAFGGDSPSAMVTASRRGKPDWSLLDGDLDGALVDLVQACLKLDPNVRLCDAGEARERLTTSIAAPRSDHRRTRGNILHTKATLSVASWKSNTSPVFSVSRP